MQKGLAFCRSSAILWCMEKRKPGQRYISASGRTVVFYGSLDRHNHAVWHVKVDGRRCSPLLGITRDAAEAIVAAELEK